MFKREITGEIIMSRDWTPLEHYIVEQHRIKQGYGSWWDWMKDFTITYGNTTSRVYSDEEIELRMQYPYLGKFLNRFEKFYNTLSSMPGGLSVLERCDKEIEMFISCGMKNKDCEDTPTIKWFKGELDQGFYYGTYNDELFKEYMVEEAKSVAKLETDLKEPLNDKIDSASSKVSNVQPKSTLNVNRTEHEH